MTNILVITSSPLGAASTSRKLADSFVQQWQEKQGPVSVVTRDLSTDPLPHLDGILLGGFTKPEAEQSPQEKAANARSLALIDEVRQADVVVIAAPMHNFGVPSTLKAWIDHVVRAGHTFKYTEQGPVGLLDGKRAFVLTSHGGMYSSGPSASMNHATPYLKVVLGFIGISDTVVVSAEGQAMGAETAQQNVFAAQAQLGAALAA
ncbi:MAG: FMN-dependent NADH-azoreductase [Magnetospiraceae bacterium]